MGAYDVHQARLIGSVAEKTGIVPFMELVEHVMTQQPYANARTVYWVVDNGSSDNTRAVVEKIQQRSVRSNAAGIAGGQP